MTKLSDHPLYAHSRDRSIHAHGDSVASREIREERPVVRLISRIVALTWMQALASLALGIGLWELAVRVLNPPKIYIVAPSEIAATFIDMLLDGELVYHIQVSGLEFILGYGLAVVLGITLGIFLALVRPVRIFLAPWMSALYSTPILALGPLFIVSLGIGILSKVVIIFLVCVFPIMISTQVAVSQVDPSLLTMARSFSLSPVQIIWKVRFRYAFPNVIAGLRVASARGLVGIVVGELFGARAGLGYLVITSSQVFQTARVFVAVTVLAGAGIVMNGLFSRLEEKLAPWKE